MVVGHIIEGNQFGKCCLTPWYLKEYIIRKSQKNRTFIKTTNKQMHKHFIMMYVKPIVISALKYMCDNQLKKSYIPFSGNDYLEGE